MATIQSNIGLVAGWADNENGWGASMNAALRILDSLVQGAVTNRTTNAPPATPADGDLYIIGPAPTGAWAAKANQIARWSVAGLAAPEWEFVAPKNGWTVWDRGAAERVRYDGAVWVAETTPTNDISGKADKLVEVINEVGAELQITAVKANKVLRYAPAAGIASITLYAEASEAIPVGSTFTVRVINASNVSIAAPSNVTVNAPVGMQAKPRGQHSTIMLHKVAVNEWDVVGDLAATV